MTEASSPCLVKFKVESTDPKKPLTGKVNVYLHPTYCAWSTYDLEVKNGVAEDELNPWGMFTMGMDADGANPA